MPRVVIPENQVAVAQPVSVALQPANNNGGVGGAIGAGLQELGGAIDNHAMTLQAIDLDNQQTDFAKRFAQTRLDIDKQRTDARASVGPGAVGYTQSVDEAIADATKPLLTGVADKRLKTQFEGQIAQWRSQLLGSDYQFEMSAKAAKTFSDTSEAISAASARVRTSDDPKVYEAEQLTLDKSINDLTLDDGTKAKLHKQGSVELAGSRISRQIDTNPQGAIDDIDKGAYNSILDGKALDQYRAQAEVGVRRLQSEAEHRAALAKSGLNEEIATTKAKLSAGITVPDEQLASLAQRAGTIGDTSSQFDLQEARVRARTNDEIKGWTPQQFEAERNRLRGLKKPSSDDQIRLDQIEKRMPSLVSEFDKDPGAWAATNGVPPPVLDWNNGQTLAARKQWQNTVQRATGRPVPFFSPNEIADMKAKAESSPAGEAQVIDRVAMIDGRSDRTGGMSAVKEMLRILPEDPKAARLVLLNPTARVSALAGISLLKERPDLLPDKNTRQPFLDRIGAAGAMMDGNQREGVYDVAKGIYLDGQRRNGTLGAKADAIDPDAWNMAIHRALGGRFDGRHWFGGIWTWGKNQVLLPPTITGKQLEGAMTWLGTARWDNRAQETPVWSDGSAMPPSALKNFTPVLRPDGRYEFHGPNGTIVRKKSGVFTYDLAGQAQRFPQ